MKNGQNNIRQFGWHRPRTATKADGTQAQETLENTQSLGVEL
jgi:hypothetical protein